MAASEEAMVANDIPEEFVHHHKLHLTSVFLYLIFVSSQCTRLRSCRSIYAVHLDEWKRTAAVRS